jgi:hypothetical protein
MEVKEMKIKAEHYQVLRKHLYPIMKRHTEFTKDSLLESMRQRWDMFWEGITPAIKTRDISLISDFGYLSDNHLDTAIKAIIREYYS